MMQADTWGLAVSPIDIACFYPDFLGWESVKTRVYCQVVLLTRYPEWNT